MNILVTGGCGFIGTNLIDQLIKANSKTNIRVLDSLSVGNKEDLSEIAQFKEIDISLLNDTPEGLELVVGNIMDFNTCLKCCKGINVIIHLAANTGVPSSIENPKHDMEINVIGTFNIIEAARQEGVNRFVFASSSATIGESEPPIHEKKVPRPISPYGSSKMAGEAYCSSYAHTFGIKTVMLRFGNVYGPRSKHKSSVVAKFFKQALQGEALEIYGDGNQTRDFIYIEDLIYAVILATRFDHGGEVFQIATYRETTVSELAEKVRMIVEGKTNKKVSIVYGASRVGDVQRNFSDISKAREILGFEPRYDLDSGLEKTFDYFFDSCV